MIRETRSLARSGMPGVADIVLPDFDPGWAGPGRTPDEFCFASMDGELRITTTGGSPVSPFEHFTPLRDSDLHDEAVNGVAFAGDAAAAISTPSGILFLTFQYSTDRARPKVEGSLLWHGSHEIIASSVGTFLAPLGGGGLLVSRRVGDRQSNKIVESLDDRLDFYTVSELRSNEDSHLLACAARRHGMAIVDTDAPVERTSLWRWSFPGLDIVDVAPLRLPTESQAVVALGRDGSLAFVRDVKRKDEPGVVSMDVVRGTAYRVFPTRGGVLLLTGKGLHVFPDLIDRYTQGRLQESLPTMFVPFEAVDAGLCDDRWLLVVLADRVRRLDLEVIFELALRGVERVAPATPKRPFGLNQIETRSSEPLFVAASVV